MRIFGKIIWCCILAVLSQLLIFQNNLVIRHGERGIEVLVDGEEFSVTDLRIEELKQLEFRFQNSAAGVSGLGALQVLNTMSNEVVREEHPPIFLLFGRDVFGTLSTGKDLGKRKPTLGDWSLDRGQFSPFTIALPNLDKYEITINYLGRGDKFLRLQGSENLQINIRDGYIDNDFSICNVAGCKVATSLKPNWKRSMKRILGDLASWIFLAALLGLVLDIVSALARKFDKGLCLVQPFKEASKCQSVIPGLVWAAAALAFVISTYFGVWVLGAIPHVPDSAVYYRQAIGLTRGMLNFPYPTYAPRELIIPNGAVDLGNGLFTFHYNRFWPALLALALKAGAAPLLNPILGSLSVLLVYYIGCRLYDRKHGVVAALLMSLSPIIWIMAGDFMSHTACSFFIVLSLSLILAALNLERIDLSLFSGLAWGLAFGIRQGSTLFVTLPVLVYLVARYWRKFTLAQIAALLGGISPFILLYLVDNYLLTGSPWVSPYAKYHGLSISLANLPVGLRNANAAIGFLMPILFGPLLPPLVWGLIFLPLVIERKLEDWFLIAFFFSLAVLHTLIPAVGAHGYGPRFLYEGIFALFILGARGLILILSPLRSWLRVGVVGAIGITLAFNLYLNLSALPPYRNYNGIVSNLNSVISKAAPDKTVFLTDNHSWQGMDIGASIWDPEFKRGVILYKDPEKQYLRVLANLADKDVKLISGEGLVDYPWWRTAEGQEYLKNPATQDKLWSGIREVAPPKGKNRALVQPGQKEQQGSGIGYLTQILQFLRWLAVIELLSIIAWAWLRGAFAKVPDAAFGLSKAFGLLLAPWFIWLLHSWRVIESSLAGELFAVFTLSLISWYVYRRKYVPLPSETKRNLYWGEFLFIGVFILLTILRAFQPEIYWGEKPMDSTFLRYFARGADLPPEDPWAVGQPLKYYYFSSFLFGLISRLAAVDPSISFNLAIVTVFAVLGGALYSLILLLTERRLASVLAALLILFSANLEWIHLYFFKGQSLNFDLFWATTRLFTSPAFVEYPLWSFLFGDLHAHVVAIPFLVLFIALLVWQIFFVDDRLILQNWPESLLRAALLGLVWGCFTPLNAWDFLNASVIALVFMVAYTLYSLSLEGSLKLVFSELGIKISLLGFSAILSRLLYYPFFASSGSNISVGWNWVATSEFNHLPQVLIHIGVWLLLALLSIGWLSSVISFRRPRRGVLVIMVATLASLTPLGLGLYSSEIRGTEPPWLFLEMNSFFCFIASLFILLFEPSRKRAAIAAALVAGALLSSYCEMIYVMDRMNTIFKTYNSVWLLFSISAVSLFILFTSNCRSRSRDLVSRITGSIFSSIGWVAILTVVISGMVMISIMTTFQRVKGPRPTLDGTAWMWAEEQDQAQLIRWINKNITGTPPILEAQGPSYQSYTRIAMHTGLPVLLGWEYHVSQRGTSQDELRIRREEVKSIYETEDPQKANYLLRKYGVRYVVVGELERSTYAAVGLKKFEEARDCFRNIYNHGQSQLFEVLSLGCGLRLPEDERAHRAS